MNLTREMFGKDNAPDISAIPKGGKSIGGISAFPLKDLDLSKKVVDESSNLIVDDMDESDRHKTRFNMKKPSIIEVKDRQKEYKAKSDHSGNNSVSDQAVSDNADDMDPTAKKTLKNRRAKRGCELPILNLIRNNNESTN